MSKNIVKIQATDRIILGIDPGTNILGYGIVSIKAGSLKVLAMDVFRMEKLEDHMLKLKYIFENTLKLIDKYNPDELSVEAPFFGKNVQSMLKLGRAQGVAIAAGLYRSVPIFEYSPRKIKQSITGNGNASKEQVAAMLRQMYSIKKMPALLDATDGLAAAVCHYNQGGPRSGISRQKKYSGWETFVKDNPARTSKS